MKYPTFLALSLGAFMLPLSSVAEFSVTDPTGTQGTDVNTAGRTIFASYGNTSLVDLNNNADQFTVPFDNTGEFPAFSSGDLATVTYTPGSDFGADLDINFDAPNLNWWVPQNNALRTSSTNQSLNIRNLESTISVTFSSPMLIVGFTLNGIIGSDIGSGTEDNLTVEIYSDLAGSNSLATFSNITGSGTSVNTGAHIFVGYENITGIQRFDITFNDVNTTDAASRTFDDLSFVAIPEPGTYAIILATGTLALAILRRRRN